MQCVNHPEVDQGIVRCLRCHRPFCADCVVMLRGYWYCASCKDEQVRDIQSGTTSAMELASLGRRFAAALIDGIVASVAAAFVMLPIYFLLFGAAFFTSSQAGAAGRSGEAEAMLGLAMVALYPLMFLVTLGIPLVYEGLMLQRRGQTVGKMALSIRVVTLDGNALTRGQAWGRAALKNALSTMCSCIGMLADDLPAFYTAERTALHDMAAKTRVVRLQ